MVLGMTHGESVDGGADADWWAEVGFFPALQHRARRAPEPDVTKSAAGVVDALPKPATPFPFSVPPDPVVPPPDRRTRTVPRRTDPQPAATTAGPDPDPAASPVEQANITPLEQLEAQICTLAGSLASSTCRWLRLVEEFDRRKGWAQWGVKSCAHWLSWACSVAPGAAREYVRVAAALPGLPLIDKAFVAGRLSYSKVRAITRVADRVAEPTLLEQGLTHTASQLERLIRGYRKSNGSGRDQQERRRARWFWDDDGMLVITARLPSDEGAILIAALEQAQSDQAQRQPGSTQDANTSAGPSAHQPTAAPTSSPAVGSVGPTDSQGHTSTNGGSSAATTAGDPSADNRVDHAPNADPTGGDGADGDGAAGDWAGGERAGGNGARGERAGGERSDAAQTCGAPNSAAQRNVAQTINSDSPTQNDGPAKDPAADPSSRSEQSGMSAADALVTMARNALAAGQADSSGDDTHLVVLHVDADVLTRDDAPDSAVCRIEDGPGVDRLTALRITCDAALIALIDSAVPGENLRLGRKTRKISPALRRALRFRDGGCQFPGCSRTRHLEAHHVEHWLKGGATDLDNLVLLCRFHHMAIHEDGFVVRPATTTDQSVPTANGRDVLGGWEFFRPDGKQVPANGLLGDWTRSPAVANSSDATDDTQPDAIRPGWRGEPFSLVDSVAVLCAASA